MTRCSITCMEPGCQNKIYYQSNPNHEEYMDEIPLYCNCHATEEGRHSAKRKLR
jgi:hypothetical protein